MSDGTAAGTRRLTDFADPQAFSSGTRVTALGSRTVFIAGQASDLGQVWGTDGTPAGTRRLVPCDGCGTSWLVQDGSLAYFASRDAAHGEELWRTDGTPQGTRLLADIAPGATGSSPFAPFPLGGGVAYLADADGPQGPARHQMWWVPREGGTARQLTDLPGDWWTAPLDGAFNGVAIGSRLLFRASDGIHGPELWRVAAEVPACGGDVLCLGAGDRFALEISWRLADGTSGRGHPQRLTVDTGYFWFFGPDNVEVVAKVLDGRTINRSFWLFYGALSDVEYTLTLTDRTTGAMREYRNPRGRMASVADTGAIVDAAAATGALALGSAVEEIAAELAAAPAPAGGSCVADAQTLCLQDGRFRVRATWTDFSGNQGVGKAVRLTADTGYFWFFGADNVEVVLKVLDGRPVNDHFWVFYGALSSVEYVLTVTDTVTGVSRTYRNPSGELASRADTRALPAE